MLARREQSPEVAMRMLVSLLTLAALAACTSRDSEPETTDAASGGPVLATQMFGPLGVPVGWARGIEPGARPYRWCAEFEEHELAVGDTVTLIWPDSGTGAAATAAMRVQKATPGTCDKLADTSDIGSPDGTAYELALADSADTAAVADVAMSPAIAIRGSARWMRGPDRFLHADLDGDENPEQARLCTSNEGVHLTLWTLVDSAAAGKPRAHRRWHAYQPLGYDVEPSCTARETDDPPEAAEGGR